MQVRYWNKTNGNLAIGAFNIPKGGYLDFNSLVPDLDFLVPTYATRYVDGVVDNITTDDDTTVRGLRNPVTGGIANLSSSGRSAGALTEGWAGGDKGTVVFVRDHAYTQSWIL